jgi:hypothetical protein
LSFEEEGAELELRRKVLMNSKRKACFVKGYEMRWNNMASASIEIDPDIVVGVEWFVLGIEPGLEGIEVGAPIALLVQMKPGSGKVMRVKQKPTTREHYRLASWRFQGMSQCWLLKDERFQDLTPLDADRTRYTTSATFLGPLAPLVVLTQGKKVKAGFERTAQALTQTTGRRRSFSRVGRNTAQSPQPRPPPTSLEWVICDFWNQHNGLMF